jgi:nucleotide-binding universal stress UspA family protein
MFRGIVVPVDGSALAESILPHVARLAADTPLEVVLLAVGPMPEPVGEADRQPVYPVGDWRSFRAGIHHGEAVAPGSAETTPRPTRPVAYLDQVLADEKRELGQYLDGQARALAGAGVHVRTQVRIGDPAAEIVSCAQEEGADAIAMSTHGRTGLDRLIHGSVAGAVLRQAELPILLFRPTEHAFETNQAPARRGGD